MHFPLRTLTYTPINALSLYFQLLTFSFHKEISLSIILPSLLFPSRIFLTLSRLNSFFSMTNNLFSPIHTLLVKSKQCVFLRFAGFSSGLFLMLIKNAVWALFMCILAFGGALVGIVTGAIKGQTTETGLLRGAAVGAVTGAITTVQLVELILNGEPFSKVALVCSLVNGKVFMEWVSPAVLKAYQWQVSTVESSLREISDIFDINATKGLSQEVIKKLPKYNFCAVNTCGESQEVTCAICLQDFKDGDSARVLPSCKHSFHTQCIDEWLIRHGSCPICRLEI